MDHCVVCGRQETVIRNIGTGEAFCYEHGNALNEEYQEWRANHPAPEHKNLGTSGGFVSDDEKRVSIDGFDWDQYYREQAGIAPLGSNW